MGLGVLAVCVCVNGMFILELLVENQISHEFHPSLITAAKRLPLFSTSPSLYRVRMPCVTCHRSSFIAISAAYIQRIYTNLLEITYRVISIFIYISKICLRPVNLIDLQVDDRIQRDLFWNRLAQAGACRSPR